MIGIVIFFVIRDYILFTFDQNDDISFINSHDTLVIKISIVATLMWSPYCGDLDHDHY